MILLIVFVPTSIYLIKKPGFLAKVRLMALISISELRNTNANFFEFAR